MIRQREGKNSRSLTGSETGFTAGVGYSSRGLTRATMGFTPIGGVS